MLLSIPELISQILEGVRRLPAEEAYEECRKNNGLRIDVREPGEVAENPIKGSINIPRGVLEMRMLADYADENLPVYIHCATGARATLAAEQLMRLGYTHVTAISCPLAILRNIAA